MNIISVSRRTDIPACYSDWFFRRIEEGMAGVINPFNGTKRLVSLIPEAVAAFVFTSKNFGPLMPYLPRVEQRGHHRFLFGQTITGLPKCYEPGSPSPEEAVAVLKCLSVRYGVRSVTWRYDPIILSEPTSSTFHVANFSRLARALEGVTQRCVVSFVSGYRQTRRRMAAWRLDGVQYSDETENQAPMQELASRLVAIAQAHGIELFSCSQEFLLPAGVRRASCVDSALVEELYFPGRSLGIGRRKTRPGCGCSDAVDLGRYGTCLLQCRYCYANGSFRCSSLSATDHDPAAAFLGFKREVAGEWVRALRSEQVERHDPQISFPL